MSIVPPVEDTADNDMGALRNPKKGKRRKQCCRISDVNRDNMNIFTVSLESVSLIAVDASIEGADSI